MSQIVEAGAELAAMAGPDALDRRDWRWAKRLGFGDAPARARSGASTGDDVRAARQAAGVDITYKTVDTCAAEFAASTPYHYGTYEDTSEVAPLTKPAVVILGSGPNRIGQGVEFDYCCVHAAFALSDAGLRDGDGQLQPRDGLDRLRHERPALLRAAVDRGRPQRVPHAAGAGGAARGDRGPRRPDAAEARPRARGGRASRSWARARSRSTSPRTATGSTRCATGSRSRSRPGAPPTTRRRGAGDRGRDRLPGAGPAVVRARRPRDADRVRRRGARRGDGRARGARARSGARVASRPSARR